MVGELKSDVDNLKQQLIEAIKARDKAIEERDSAMKAAADARDQTYTAFINRQKQNPLLFKQLVGHTRDEFEAQLQRCSLHFDDF